MPDDKVVAVSAGSQGSRLVHGVLAKGAILVTKNKLNLDIAASTQDGSRLVAEITFQKAERTCPKCGSMAISPMANSQELRCAQCSKQFVISEQREDQVFVVGIADDAYAVAKSKYDADGKKAEADKTQQPGFVWPGANPWKRAAAYEVEPGIYTEVWVALNAKAVSKVTVNLNNPANYQQPTSVTGVVLELVSWQQPTSVTGVVNQK